ncbi:MAG: arsenosugar biosynthesis radical SAM protein ArsS [Planctomycetota bacterium]|nr:arsenosugar biosynthesis radical SAM protein ArsS [Planctomycetota bacterium]
MPKKAMSAPAALNPFAHRMHQALGEDLRGLALRTIQVNVGLRCNLACRHCHVESSPKRTERMSWETMTQVLAAANACGAETIDITGGAPEMHPRIQDFIREARSRGLSVVLRSNLTVLLEEGFEHLPFFFKEEQVSLVASLPCYLEKNVDWQRGTDVYRKSIEAIRLLNALGYGEDPRLRIDLVYNPLGPHLPPKQEDLERDYRKELWARHGIYFTRLIAITNMPIGRFLHDLEREGKAQAYAALLSSQFNAGTLQGLMCRHQIGVRWDGILFDCDFNLALKLPVAHGVPRHIGEFSAQDLAGRPIATGPHCFACTAGCGSSCGGALT